MEAKVVDELYGIYQICIGMVWWRDIARIIPEDTNSLNKIRYGSYVGIYIFVCIRRINEIKKGKKYPTINNVHPMRLCWCASNFRNPTSQPHHHIYHQTYPSFLLFLSLSNSHSCSLYSASSSSSSSSKI